MKKLITLLVLMFSFSFVAYSDNRNISEWNGDDWIVLMPKEKKAMVDGYLMALVAVIVDFNNTLSKIENDGAKALNKAVQKQFMLEQGDMDIVGAVDNFYRKDSDNKKYSIWAVIQYVCGRSEEIIIEGLNASDKTPSQLKDGA